MLISKKGHRAKLAYFSSFLSVSNNKKKDGNRANIIKEPQEKKFRTNMGSLGGVASIVVARFLIGGAKPQITCNDVIRNFQKRNFLWAKIS